MKFGFRKPSLKKMVSARISPKRIFRNITGLKVPKGFGWLFNPKKALYNKVYNRTSFSFLGLLKKFFNNLG